MDHKGQQAAYVPVLKGHDQKNNAAPHKKYILDKYTTALEKIDDSSNHPRIVIFPNTHKSIFSKYGGA